MFEIILMKINGTIKRFSIGKAIIHNPAFLIERLSVYIWS